MRIISWNCNMSFARKRELMLALKPDILILQECSEKDILETTAPFKHWVGSNKHKGLGLIGFAEHDYKISELYTGELPWFIPLEITDLNLHVLAVWACVKTQQLRHVRVTHDAIDHYEQFITDSPTIITGDFNSNTIWDKLHSLKSHGALVGKLHNLEIDSLYHFQTNEPQGAEKMHTLYMYRHPEKGYHIDFVFMSHTLLEKSKMDIGKPDIWLSESDHVPIEVTVVTSLW